MRVLLAFLLLTSPLYAGGVNSRDRGLLLLLKMDEGAGTTLGNRQIDGGQASAEGTGQAFSVGKFGKSIDLDGNGGFTFPDASRFDVISWTAAAWIYPETATGGRRRIVQQTDVGNFWGLAYNNQFIENLASHGGCSPCTSNGTVPLYQWSHVVAVKKASEYLRIYINGKRDFNQNTNNFTTWTMAADVGIGVYIPSSNERFIGRLDDVACWNRALSDGEIMQLYLDGVGEYAVQESRLLTYPSWWNLLLVGRA